MKYASTEGLRTQRERGRSDLTSTPANWPERQSGAGGALATRHMAAMRYGPTTEPRLPVSIADLVSTRVNDRATNPQRNNLGGASQNTLGRFESNSEQGPGPSAVQSQAAVRTLYRTGLIHPKLTIGATDDPSEGRADDMADQAVRGKAVCECGGDGCAECRSQQTADLQRTPSPDGVTDQDSLPNSELTGLNHGEPLSPHLRANFEPSFGADFSSVRLHTDKAAATAAQAIDARAFTHRGDIVFGENEYRPATEEGRRLIAHELAHVWQQQQGADADVVRRTPDGGAGESEPGAEYDPCTVDEHSLTNRQLLTEWWRAKDYLDAHPRGEDYWYDYANLMRRLVEERRSRMRGGHIWLAESSIRSVPGVLYEIQSAGGLAARVVIADAQEEAGAPQQRTTSSVMTPDQFRDFLHRQNIPQMDVEEFYAQQLGVENPEQLEILLPPPPEPEPSPFFGVRPIGPEVLLSPFYQDPFFQSPFSQLLAPGGQGGVMPGLGAGYDPRSAQAGLSGLSGSGLYTSSYDMYTRRNMLRQVYSSNVDLTNPRSVAGAELQWRGGLPEASVEAGTYGQRLRMQPLNQVQPNFRVFDTSTRGSPRVLISTTHTLPDPATGDIEFSHYRTKFRIMMGNTESQKMTNAINDLNAHYGTSLTVQDVNQRNFLAVPDDQVQQVRQDIEQAIGGQRARATSYSNLLDTLLQNNPVTINNVTYNSWNQVQAARTNRQLSTADYGTLRQTLAQQASQRVIGVGMTTSEILAMQNLRVGTQDLSPGQFNVMAPGEVLEMRRLMATGLDEASARSQVARGSARRGAGMGALGAAGSGVIQIAMDPNNPQAWRDVAINVPLGAAGGAGEAWMQSQFNMRVINPMLTRAAAPGATAGTSRLLTGAGFLGRGAGATGAAAIAAPAITLGTMGIQDLFFGADYTRIDYAAKGSRTAVSGGIAAAGGWLAAGGVGFLAGSEVPVLGNAVGFLVGVGLYFLADETVGEDVESGVREYMGEQGCVGGRMGNTSSSSSSSPSPTRQPFSSPPFTCFVADTPIQLEDGSQSRIDGIRVGDQVLSYDESTQKTVFKPVVRVHSGSVLEVLCIQLDGDLTIQVTPPHMLRTPEMWLPAGEIGPGHQVMVYDANSGNTEARTVVSVAGIKHSGPVFDLTVEDTHTYFAGGVLAHNKLP